MQGKVPCARWRREGKQVDSAGVVDLATSYIDSVLVARCA